MALILPVAALAAQVAYAGPETTRMAMDRLGEVLTLRVEDGLIDPNDVMPAVLVAATPRYEETQGWFATETITLVERAFGAGGLRVCEACQAPRVVVEDGALAYQTGPIGLDEVRRLDDQIRGDAPASRSAIWIEETPAGVSVRIVALDSGRVLFAQNVDPFLVENQNTQRMYTLSEELERRARGDGLTQAFVDFVVYPGQHISLDWTDQWGPTNANLTGITLSLFDPVIGIGIAHHRRIEPLNALLGLQGIVSLPTAIARGAGATGGLLDPMITGVGMLRVPFGRSNYGVAFAVSTNGEIGAGLSLMNISLLPVIP